MLATTRILPVLAALGLGVSLLLAGCSSDDDGGGANCLDTANDPCTCDDGRTGRRECGIETGTYLGCNCSLPLADATGSDAATSPDSTAGPAAVCTPGAQQGCTCDGAAGQQLCGGDGQWGNCLCTGGPGGTDGADAGGTPTDTAPAPTDTAEADAGSPADVQASTGACENEGDIAALGAIADRIEEVIGNCARNCAFGGDVANCATACVEQDAGVSNACASCFGEVTQCTVASCALQCISPSSAQCTQCRADNCDPAFEACAGVIP